MAATTIDTAPRRGADGRPWPGFGEALAVWSRVALLSFGGPAGQIAVMHRILVEERRWLGEARFLHALNFCMLLPGPEAQQLAVYVGWLMHGTAGGLAAGTLFVLPGAIAILALSWIYALWGSVGAVAALFFGLKAAVLAIVLQAVLRIGRRALPNRTLLALAALSFVAIFLFDVPFPAIVLAAGVAGYAAGRAGLPAFAAGGGHGGRRGAGVADAGTILGDETPGTDGRRAVPRVVAVLAALWLAPVAALLLLLGPGDVFTEIAVLFAKLAVVTFGGAYAVLAYVAQAAVEGHGWLAAGEMLDGLGLAETTPGPLIMVTQFVGFLAAWRDPGALPPPVAGTLGALLTTWVTFVPCFLWIFLGAPHVERLRASRALSAALAAITAAVVGVVLNLALWFGLHVLFRDVGTVAMLGMRLPLPSTPDPTAIALAAVALVAAFAFRVGAIPLLLGCAAAGLALHGLGAAGG